MLIADLLTDEIPPLKKTDTVKMALDWMEQFKVSHLAVVDNRELIGLVSEHELIDSNHPDDKIMDLKGSLLRPIVHNYQHTYDLLKLMMSFNLTVMPVLDDKEQYKGCISLKGLLYNISTMASVQNVGGVIVLEVNQVDYSLTQIASIVEGNDAKILSAHISSDADSNKVDVTLKINREDLSRILQTFNRYNYTVKASFQNSDFETGLKDKLDEFLHFLNI